MAIRIKKSSVDGKTGHIQVTFCVEETVDKNTTRGPEETSGLWPHALMATYHGPEKATKESIKKAVTKWLKERHDDAMQRKHHIEMTSSVADSLAGTLLEFE
jgi:hypothetical protein